MRDAFASCLAVAIATVASAVACGATDDTSGSGGASGDASSGGGAGGASGDASSGGGAGGASGDASSGGGADGRTAGSGGVDLVDTTPYSDVCVEMCTRMAAFNAEAHVTCADSYDQEARHDESDALRECLTSCAETIDPGGINSDPDCQDIVLDMWDCWSWLLPGFYSCWTTGTYFVDLISDGQCPTEWNELREFREHGDCELWGNNGSPFV